MKRYAIKVEYIGKNYSGSQLQAGKKPRHCPPTIQSELEKALCTLIGECDESVNPNTSSNKAQNKRIIKTIFSGRTDKGVNSKGQIVQFESTKPIVASRFINSMNGLLPSDISVSDLKEVSQDFNAQKSAKKRYYKYVFYNRKQRSAFDGDIPLVRYELNLDRMQKALKYLEGEHDFSAFKSSGTANPAKICFIYKAECEKLGDAVEINLVGNRFLYNMVRAIVGTLLLIERSNLPPEYLKEVLDARDRKKAGKTVSPYGLTLMKVDY